MAVLSQHWDIVYKPSCCMV